MIRRCVAFVLFCGMLLGPGGADAATTARWVVTSDIHFDPFTNTRLALALNEAPAQRWRGIFAASGPMPFSGYGADTNYALLESALVSMKSEDPDPPMVIISGDFLAHSFRKKFEAMVKPNDEAAYDAFVDKTIAFLAMEFRTAFPRAQFIPVLGNNDSYCGDYLGAPQSPFLAHMAADWAGVVGAPAAAWSGQFSIGGYYTTTLPAAGARAIVLNDVFWSSNYSNSCGSKSDDPGGDELTWLRSALSENSSAPVWVIAHIPPGPDVFSSLESVAAVKGITMFLNPRYNDALLDQLVSAQSNIVMSIAGHTHMNAFRVIGSNANAPAVPMLLVPAMSPSFAGNPAYDIVDVDTATAAVSDYRVFVLDGLAALAKDPRHAARWRREYDFSQVFGGGRIDAARFDALERALFGDSRVRGRFEQFYDSESGRAPITDATWRAYWCGNVALTAPSYAACAAPEVQHALPAQPSAPPIAPSPAATP